MLRTWLQGRACHPLSQRGSQSILARSHSWMKAGVRPVERNPATFPRSRGGGLGRGIFEACIDTRHTPLMIKSFRHKGLERFFLHGDKRGIQARHAGKLSRQLAVLNRATCPGDVNLPGWHLHPLKGDLAGHWATHVSGNWRQTFAFERGDVVLLDNHEYH